MRQRQVRLPIAVRRCQLLNSDRLQVLGHRGAGMENRWHDHKPLDRRNWKKACALRNDAPHNFWRRSDDPNVA